MQQVDSYQVLRLRRELRREREDRKFWELLALLAACAAGAMAGTLLAVANVAGML